MELHVRHGDFFRESINKFYRLTQYEKLTIAASVNGITKVHSTENK